MSMCAAHPIYTKAFYVRRNDYSRYSEAAKSVLTQIGEDEKTTSQLQGEDGEMERF